MSGSVINVKTLGTVLTVLISLVTTVVFASPNTSGEVPSVTVKLNKNSLLSIINPIVRQDDAAKQALKVYYEKALPMAESYGYRNHGSLLVTETFAGSDEPKLFVVASWPDEAADFAFESAPEWKKYKPLRPKIWQTLNFYKAPSQQEKDLSFRQDKHYTIAFAWFNQQNPGDYHEYLENIETTVNQLGGSFIHSMQSPRFVSHNEGQKGPDEITFVEWDSESALNQFKDSETFRQYSPLLRSGTERFELYRVKPNIR